MEPSTCSLHLLLLPGHVTLHGVYPVLRKAAYTKPITYPGG